MHILNHIKLLGGDTDLDFNIGFLILVYRVSLIEMKLGKLFIENIWILCSLLYRTSWVEDKQNLYQVYFTFPLPSEN